MKGATADLNMHRGDESHNHGARTCRVSDDGKLCITRGQPFNAQPTEKVALYEELGGGGMVRINAFDGSGREVVARGVRSSIGMDINPKDKTVWFTANQTNGRGNEIAPGELRRITKVGGKHFGYPYIPGNIVQITGTAAAPDLKDMKPPANWSQLSNARPGPGRRCGWCAARTTWGLQIVFPAHQARLGMTSCSGQMFPANYQGDIFVAAHGSWNRTKAVGRLINFVSLKADGSAD